MSGNRKLILLRLEKQQKKLNDDPIQNVLVAREGILNFHFCIYGLDGPYSGGFYHGVLELSDNYPFAPPQLKFYTPSGRFQIDKPICTTFTNFHKQSWSSGWNVRSMIVATVSFMTGNEVGVASKNDLDLVKRNYASQSLAFNNKNPLFCQLFRKKLTQIKSVNMHNTSKQTQKDDKNSSEVPNSKSDGIYLLYGILILVILTYAYLKS